MHIGLDHIVCLESDLGLYIENKLLPSEKATNFIHNCPNKKTIGDFLYAGLLIKRELRYWCNNCGYETTEIETTYLNILSL